MTASSVNLPAPRSGAPATSAGLVGGRRLDRRRALIAAAVLSVLGLVVLSVLVAAGLTQPLDDAVRETFRPGDRWGPTQARFGYLVNGFSPPVMASLLAVGSVIAAWRAHSLRPVILADATGSIAVALTLAAKLLLQRADGHGDLHGVASSYPSGHLVLLVICAGDLLLLFLPETAWLWAALAAVVLLMGVSILVVAMHWLTDVVGSALLGMFVLCVASLFRNWLSDAAAGVRP